MKAILLVAGSGSRLLPFTIDRPKCMVEIQNRTLLSYQLAVLDKFDFVQKIAVTGYLGESIDDSRLIIYKNDQYATTNMVHSLYCARDEFKSAFVLCYGDIVYSPLIMEKLLRSSADIAVVVDKQWEYYWRARFEDPLADAESLQLTEDGQILSIGRKMVDYKAIQGQFIGLVKFSANGAAALSAVLNESYLNKTPICGKAFDKAYTTDLLQEMIDRGHSVTAVITDEPWVEIDSVHDLELAENQSRINIITQKTNAYVYRH